MQEIIASVDSIIAQIDKISEGIKKINFGSQELASTTEEQSASIENIATSAQNLSDMAENLQSLVGKFKLVKTESLPRNEGQPQVGIFVSTKLSCQFKLKVLISYGLIVNSIGPSVTGPSGFSIKLTSCQSKIS